MPGKHSIHSMSKTRTLRRPKCTRGTVGHSKCVEKIHLASRLPQCVFAFRENALLLPTTAWRLGAGAGVGVAGWAKVRVRFGRLRKRTKQSAFWTVSQTLPAAKQSVLWEASNTHLGAVHAGLANVLPSQTHIATSACYDNSDPEPSLSLHHSSPNLNPPKP